MLHYIQAQPFRFTGPRRSASTKFVCWHRWSTGAGYPDPARPSLCPRPPITTVNSFSGRRRRAATERICHDGPQLDEPFPRLCRRRLRFGAVIRWFTPHHFRHVGRFTRKRLDSRTGRDGTVDTLRRQYDPSLVPLPTNPGSVHLRCPALRRCQRPCVANRSPTSPSSHLASPPPHPASRRTPPPNDGGERLR